MGRRKLTWQGMCGARWPLFALACLSGCVGLPAADAFKYATQSEREDAALGSDVAGTDVVVAQDIQSNDTQGFDDADQVDSLDAATTDVGSDAAADAHDATATGDAQDAADADAAPDVAPPECVTSSDCSGKWTASELGPCRAAACVEGACSQVNQDGPCDDNSVCTTGETCAAGACTPSGALTCNDGNACTADKCDPVTGCYFVAGAGCDDGNACTEDTCDASNACVHLATDATCSDNNACTLGDACTDTVCAALDVTSCNDDNPCTDDSCDPATGCVFLANGVTCDDGDVCTLNDACGAGACVPGAKDACSDGNPCTDDACDPAAGCVHVNNYLSCDDGNKCTPGDTCQGGVCVGLAVAATAFCNDGNVCTDDTCAPATGCAHASNTAPCDDGLPCTIGDVCAGGKCTSGASECECKKDADCASKEDGNPCNGTLMCDLSSAPYKCVVSAQTIVVCDASGDTICAQNLCNKTSGVCGYVAQSEGGPCDADGSVCTQNDVCKSGNCAPGAALNCDDGQPCTTDSCDKVNGCQYANNANACNDGSACTVGDACSGGVCVPGTKTVCDDGNPCTADSCNASTGNCSYVNQIAAACNDGNACSQNDTCDSEGVCVGTAVTCDDGVVCTSDSCSPASGCVYTPNTIACDDNNACTINDSCSGGVCLGAGVTPSAYCNDNNACTSDGCDPASGCTHTNVSGACDDGNSCTSGDSCSGGSCVSGTNNCSCTQTSDCASQEDGNACNGTLICDTSALPYQCKVNPATVVTCSTSSDSTCAKNTCNPTNGSCALVAQNGGQTCNADNSVCTPGDSCQNGTCVASGTLNCDDSNPCTNDACNAVSGCTHVANTASCSDGNACTLGDVCNNSTCKAGTTRDCNDNNPCTTDSCDTQTGNCVNSNNSITCDDSSLCTTGDRCSGGECVGNAVNCDDGNVCTDDPCTPASGCKNVANTAACTDGNPCTVNDVCANETCQPGSPKSCADTIACTVDSCSTVDGTCAHTANAAACDDGNACTTDSCDPSNGCVNTAAKSCDDGNPCTVDSCNKTDGSCAHDIQSAYYLPCDDGNPCTGGDYCGPFYNPDYTIDYTKTQCNSGYANGCDDTNGCTADTCDTSSATPKCVHSAETAGTACNVCTVVSGTNWNQTGTCSGTNCAVTGSAVTCDDGNVCTNDVCQVGSAASTGGCYHNAQAGLPCDDGSVCTVNDMCYEGGVCFGKSACDDGNYCTNDSCTIVSGAAQCAYTFADKGSWCDDGNACTSPDTCGSAGDCNGAPYTCDDGTTCTNDTCDKTIGCIFTAVATACTSAAQCGSGVSCTGGYCHLACDDGNPCTTGDACASVTCTGSGIPGAIPCVPFGGNCGSGDCISGFCVSTCSDGNLCTINDACSGGTCAGTVNTCNDGDPCTDDSCNAATGTCVNTAHCDDGNPCTTDTCSGTGTCSHVSVGDGLQCGSANFCKSGSCLACTAGTVPTPYDDNGVKQLVCAFDYPVWGIRPLSPNNFVNNGDNSITDNGTGLIWMQGQFASQTQTGAMSACDTATYANKTDWRLPTVTELTSLNDYVLMTGSSVPTVFYGQGDRFWAQPSVGAGNGFDVFTSAGTTEYVGGSNTFFARCVRGQASTTPPATRYTTSGDGLTVYDNATGLLWEHTANTGLVTQQSGNSTCVGLGGNWRLPSIRELEALVDRTSAPTSYFNATAFASQTVGAYWSGTVVTPGTGGNAWVVDFSDGSTSNVLATANRYTRCVNSCDDSNPCTTDSFDKASWACKHVNLTDGTACGGAGACTSGLCNCAAGTIAHTTDDDGTNVFQCLFDFPGWGNVPAQPITLLANSDGTVSDSKTLLVWQGTDSGATTDWTTAKTKCETLFLGNKTDWRLPTPAELDSIVDFTASSAPMINTTLFPSTGSVGYWTLRTSTQTAGNYWYQSFSNGTTATSVPAGPYRSRCVRGGLQTAPTTPRFTNQGGTPTLIKDAATGLMWDQAWVSSSATIEPTASSSCSSPYRLPNIRELGSLVDRSQSSAPAMNSIFLNGNYTFWSNTSVMSNAYSLAFGAGFINAGLGTQSFYVRCVK